MTINITGGGVAISGGDVSHDGKNIGATHIHGGVELGTAQTEAPTD